MVSHLLRRIRVEMEDQARIRINNVGVKAGCEELSVLHDSDYKPWQKDLIANSVEHVGKALERKDDTCSIRGLKRKSQSE